MVDVFTLPLLLLYPILFGSTMKIADLLDEHGLKLFRGSNLLFGALYGIFGALMILGNNVLTNLLIALLIHWILRFRIDYLNHGLAGSIMLIAFVYAIPGFVFDWFLFWIILIAYSIHGLMNDAADRGKIKGKLAKYFESNSHYFTVPLILTIINSAYWIVLAFSVLHIVSYETTKHFLMKRI